MNIFFLSYDPHKCAILHCDKHVVKMILESCQILCTTWHVLDPNHKSFKPIYKKTHINHPSVKWARESKLHYNWLCQLGLALCKEYTFRYDKIHKCEQYIVELLNNIPPIVGKKWKDPPQAMPNEFKKITSLRGYRNYYANGKSHLHKWKRRQVPYFLIDKFSID